MKFGSFIQQPYPFYYRGKSLWTMSLVVLLFAFLFYFLFEPFEVNRDEHRLGFVWVSLIHAVIPAVCMLMLGASLQWMAIAEEFWTLKKEFVFFAVFLLLVGLGQFAIREIIYDNPENLSLKYLWEEVRNAFSVGALFVAIAVPVNFNRLYSKNVTHAQQLNNRVVRPVVPPGKQLVGIRTRVKTDDFQLGIAEFLFARSDRNYTEIFLLTPKGITKTLKRLPLKDLEQQLIQFPTVMQTHRSYLVNLAHVQEVHGNAQGYKLKLQAFDDWVSVSRSQISAFEQRLQHSQGIEP